jgi:hypothetical protein
VRLEEAREREGLAKAAAVVIGLRSQRHLGQTRERLDLNPLPDDRPVDRRTSAVQVVAEQTIVGFADREAERSERRARTLLGVGRSEDDEQRSEWARALRRAVALLEDVERPSELPVVQQREPEDMIRMLTVLRRERPQIYASRDLRTSAQRPSMASRPARNVETCGSDGCCSCTHSTKSLRAVECGVFLRI